MRAQNPTLLVRMNPLQNLSWERILVFPVVILSGVPGLLMSQFSRLIAGVVVGLLIRPLNRAGQSIANQLSTRSYSVFLRLTEDAIAWEPAQPEGPNP